MVVADVVDEPACVITCYLIINICPPFESVTVTIEVVGFGVDDAVLSELVVVLLWLLLLSILLLLLLLLSLDVRVGLLESLVMSIRN